MGTWVIIMMFLLLSLLFAFIPSSVEGASASTLEDYWNITQQPGFSITGNDFTFTYPGISSGFPIDITTTSQATFYGPDCKDPDTTVTSPTYDDTYFSSRSFVRDAGTTIPTLDFTLVPNVIKTDSSLYTDLGSAGSIMLFCVRMGLYTAGGASEVNFLETVVNISVSFDGSFDTGDIAVGPKEKTTTGSTKAYTVAAALCAGFLPPFQQGQVLSVCIVPDGDGIADGIELTTIDSFTWTRTGVTPQEAVKKDGSGLAFDALSAVEINPNGSLIVVSSVLYATFFAEDGDVLLLEASNWDSQDVVLEKAMNVASSRRRVSPLLDLMSIPRSLKRPMDQPHCKLPVVPPHPWDLLELSSVLSALFFLHRKEAF